MLQDVLELRYCREDRFEVVDLVLLRHEPSLTFENLVHSRFTNNRLVVEGMLYRLRTSLPWRDLPEHFGPWQTVWKRYRRYAADGTWDRMLTALLALADTTGDMDWVVSIDSTIVRAHQHAAGGAADSVSGL
ncbi:transposase [Nocardia uniformis]|uniref:transposase n=2 Tax=Nocardia uniformis TaxID=53432 RepID=UPI00082B6EDB